MTREREKVKAKFACRVQLELDQPVSDVEAANRLFDAGVKFADQHPSDETIMLVLNCIGYEEKSWVEFVRKELEKRK